MSNEHSIGDIILNERKKRLWTQAELAEKLGVSDKAISKWENGAGYPEVTQFPVLSALFEVSIDYLMTGKQREPERIIISKIELCAKEDNINLFSEIGLNFLTIRDEDNKSLYYYVKKYKSYKVLKAMFLLCNERSKLLSMVEASNHINAEQMSELLLFFIQIDCERKFLKILGCEEIRSVSDIEKYSYPLIIKYLVENFFKLSQESQDYYFGINQQYLSRKNSWSYAYVKFLELSYHNNKKLFDLLIEKVINNNNHYIIEHNKYKKSKRYYEIDDFGSKTELIKIELEKKFIASLFENGDYQATLLNEASKNKLDSHEIKVIYVKNNTKLNEIDKQREIIMHDGLVCIDELIALDNYELYKEMIENPCCIIEQASLAFNDKNYKTAFEISEKYNFDMIIEKFIRGDVDAAYELWTETIKLLEEKINQGYEYEYQDNISKIFLHEKINRQYYLAERGGLKHNKLSYLLKCKFTILFDQITRHKDIGFFKHACLTDKQNLDKALEEIVKNRPEWYEAQKLLLEAGAKLHKRWSEDDGWGYTINRDEIDHIATQLLKNQIEILERKW